MDNQPRCLDLTRLISRAGREVLTGVDRVELAYLRYFIAHPAPFFALVRTRLGFVLLDRSGAERVLRVFDGAAAWGRMDLWGRLARQANPMKRRAEADLRRWAIARAPRFGLGWMLARHLPKGSTYLNVGHSNLTDRTFFGFNRVENAQKTVLVHDTIPLDLPAHQRPGTVARFEERMRVVADHADHVICISKATEERVRHWFKIWGHEVETSVAHIGVDLAEPGPAPQIDGPYFVTLGTIEPRKNHALLLDLWDELQTGPNPPKLVIIGPRGWRNESVFERLDAAGPAIIEMNDLDDGAVAALVQRSKGMLMPSLAEGFGLPPAEALARGTPVICNNLPVFCEILGNKAIYAESDDMYLWKQSVLKMLDQTGADTKADAARGFEPPTWEAHFNHVLKVS